MRNDDQDLNALDDQQFNEGGPPVPPPKPPGIRHQRALKAALRKLRAALVSDPGNLAARAQVFSTRFHNYTPLNRMLILLQRPDATFLKGRQQWAASDGRTIRKGAPAVYVIAPDLLPGQRSRTYRFKSVKLYDVSDTDGPPIAGIAADAPLNQPHLVGRWIVSLETWVRSTGLELLHQSYAVNSTIEGATNGRTIWIRPGLPEVDHLAVLAHEIAHAKLHFRRRQRGGNVLTDRPEDVPSRDARELEAELTSFLLLAFVGVDSSRAAASYLNSWKATPKEIRARTEKCFLAACAVIRDCEKGRYPSLIVEDLGPPEAEAMRGLL